MVQLPNHAQSANLILNIHKIYDNNIFGEYKEVIGMCTYADAIEKKGIEQGLEQGLEQGET